MVEWLLHSLPQGLSKEKDRGDKGPHSKVDNSFWVYNIAQNKWTCVYKIESNSLEHWMTMQNFQPRPRYAHQIAYDNVYQVILWN